MIIDHIAKDFLGAMLRANLTGREAFTDVYAGHFITLAYLGAKDFYDQANKANLQVGFSEYEIAKALVQARLASSRLAITPELINVLITSSVHMSLANVHNTREELGLDSEKTAEPKASFSTIVGTFDKITAGSDIPVERTGTIKAEVNLVTPPAQIVENKRPDGIRFGTFDWLDQLPAPVLVAAEVAADKADEVAEEVAADKADEVAEEVAADKADEVAEEVAAEVAEEVAAASVSKKKKAKKSKAKKVKAQAKVQAQDDATEMSAT
jgi:hypothetical protein